MKQRREGQVIVEYVLTLMMALAVLSVIMAGFNGSVRRVWGTIVKDVAKACPRCPSPQ